MNCKGNVVTVTLQFLCRICIVWWFNHIIKLLVAHHHHGCVPIHVEIQEYFYFASVVYRGTTLSRFWQQLMAEISCMDTVNT